MLLEIKAKGQAGKTGSYHLLHQSRWELYMQKECFAEEEGNNQAVGQAGGIRTDRQPGDAVEEVWCQRGRQWVHGERQSRGARLCTKSMGWRQ